MPPHNKTLEMIPDSKKPKFSGKGLLLNTQSYADDEFQNKNSQRSSIERSSKGKISPKALAQSSSRYNSGGNVNDDQQQNFIF